MTAPRCLVVGGGLTVDAVASTLMVYPSLTEALMEAAE